MFGEQRIPFVQYPFSKKSETLSVNGEDLTSLMGHTNEAIYRLVEKLNAEQERLMRLLPEPPEGYRWEFEIERSDDLMQYRSMFRVVARLKEE
ncbi:hypothetical protein SEA_YUUY_42 [Microbacterium phage YuuY]|nr:hypothetical protein SEA_YUUY_42 [Microbacterium phage YuuY]